MVAPHPRLPVSHPPLCPGSPRPPGTCRADLHPPFWPDPSGAQQLEWKAPIGRRARAVPIQIRSHTRRPRFCLALLAVAAAEAVTGAPVPIRDALIFAAVSVLAILVLRFAFKGGGDTKRAQGDVNEY